MAEMTKSKPAEEKKKEEVKSSSIKKYGSFREESNLVADLEEYQKKALDEFKSLLHSALLDTNRFSPTPTSESIMKKNKKEEEEVSPPPGPASHGEINPTADEDDVAKTVEAIESTVATSPPTPPRPLQEEEEKKVNIGISIWGVPLLEEEDSSRSDTVLLKFLRAREFKAKDAMVMIRNAILWRRDFGIDDLLLLQEEEEEDLGVIPEFHKVVFMDGVDKQGHPVCYNLYGDLGEEEEKRKRFLRWRILFLEKGIRELLDFSPGGVSTMVQVTDFKNYSPAALLLNSDLRHALSLLQDNYPEFVAKQIFINVPWWYLAFKKMMSPFLTQRTKSKFVFSGPSKSAETLFNYIAPEQVPVQFGGLMMRKDAEFTTADAVHEINVKPSAKQIIEIPVAEKCILTWELRVVGWEVDFGAEFVPNTEDGYTVIIEKKKKEKEKLAASDDELVSKNSFKVSEPGKVLLTIDNTCSSKKKKILYRCKARCSS